MHNKPDGENILQFIGRPHPLYLVSALLMLLGCYLVQYAVNPSPEKLGRLGFMLGVVNIYEFCLIGIGLWLIRGRRIFVEGRLLLVLALCFLVDSTYLNTSCAGASPLAGSLINIAALALAAVKIRLVTRGLDLKLSNAENFLLGASLVVLLGMPGVFSWLLIEHCAFDGMLPEMSLYLGWWIVGIMLAFLPCRIFAGRATRDGESGVPGMQTVRDGLFVLPFLSLAIHLILAGAQYQRPFHACYLAPVLLGAACYRVRIMHATHRELKSIWPLIIASGLGILMSTSWPASLSFPVAHFQVTPFRLALGATALELTYFRLLFPRWEFPALALVYFGIAWAGKSLLAVWETVTDTASHATKILPSTTFQWGVTAAVAAFICLGLAVMATLRGVRFGGEAPTPVTSRRDPDHPQ